MLTWHNMWGLLLIVALALVLMFGFPVLSDALLVDSSSPFKALLDSPRVLRESVLNHLLMSWLPMADARSLAIWWSHTSVAMESFIGVLMGLTFFAFLVWPLFLIGEIAKWVNNTYKRSWQRSVDLANK